MSVVLLQPQCSAALEGREEEEKKTLRSADSVLHAILTGPSEKWGEEREGKGRCRAWGIAKEREKTLTHYL